MKGRLTVALLRRLADQIGWAGSDAGEVAVAGPEADVLAAFLIENGSAASGGLRVLCQRLDTWERCRLALDLGSAERCAAFFCDATTALGDGVVDMFVLSLPKGRLAAQFHLREAARLLRPPGRLALVGPVKGGLKQAQRWAEEQYGPARSVAMAQGIRLVLWDDVVGPGRPAGRPAVPYLEGRWDHLDVGGTSIPFWTRPGVFAWNKRDGGTAMLARALWAVRGAPARVLDLGSGTGVLGAVAARRFPHAEVWAVDIDAAALEATRTTFRRAGLPGDRVVPSDGTSSLPRGLTFDLIVCNPPFHQGFARDSGTAERLIRQSRDRLAPGGRLLLVANRFLPYEAVFRSVFERVAVCRQEGSYKVIEAGR